MILILGIATVLFLCANVKQSKQAYYFCFILLLGFTLFRSFEMGGVDANVYRGFFLSSEVPTLAHVDWKFWNYSNSFEFGWGFMLLASVAKTIGTNFFYFQAVDTILVFCLLGVVLKKTRLEYKQKCMFLFIFFCYNFFWYFFGLLRQNIANLIVWIVIMDWKNTEQRTPWSYVKDIVLIYIASLFHSTALLVFIFYGFFVLLHKLNTVSKVSVTVGTSILFFFFGGNLVSFATSVVASMAGERYDRYMNTASGGANIINFAIKIIFLILILYANIKEQDKECYINAILTAIMIGSINSDVTVRMVEYFAIGYYVSVPASLTATKYRSKKVFLSAGIYFAFLLILIRYVLVNASYIMDYSLYVF